MRLLPLLLFVCAVGGPADAILLDSEPANNGLQTAPAVIDGNVDHDSDGGILALSIGDVDLLKLTGLTVGEVVTVATAPYEGEVFEVPNTVLGLLDASGALVALGTFPAQNQDLPEGETLRGASSLLRVRIETAGDYFVVVGGASEAGETFADHEQVGRYVLSIHVTDPPFAAPASDDEPDNNSIETAGVGLDATTTFTHSSGILELPTNDIDYVGVTKVLEGDAIAVLTTPLVREEEEDPLEFYQPDTRIGVFSADGTLLAQNDDSANDDETGGGGSLLRLRAPADGDYYVAVTASADTGFTGVHGDPKYPYGIGTYLLSIDVAPVDPLERPPAVTFFADPPALAVGGASSEIRWSAIGATFCRAVGRAWTPSTAVSGSQLVAPAVTTEYALECSGPGGKTERTLTIPVLDVPTVSLVAEPDTVTEGGSTTLSWTSTDADFCAPVGETWTESSATQGSVVISPAQSSTYTIECSGLAGTTQASADVVVAPVPTAAITAMPSMIALGQSSVLTWTSSSATSCAPVGAAWTESRASAGQQAVIPLATTTYTIECSGPGGSVQSSTTVTVVPLPELSFAALPAALRMGESSVLSWDAIHADSCTPVGEEWTSSRLPAGSESVTPTQTTTYTLSCTGFAGTTQAQLSVTVYLVPTVSLVAKPGLISAGTSTRLQWSSTDADSCEPIGDGWTSLRGPEGAESLLPLETRTYTIECSGPGGSARDSVDVEVRPAPTLSLRAEPASIEFGGSTTIHWSATNASACGALGIPWTTNAALEGSEVVMPEVTTTYLMVCGDALAAVQAEVRVEVIGSPTVELSAEPAIIEPGDVVTLSWSSANANACEPLESAWTQQTGTSGSEELSPRKTTTYSLACSGDLSTAQDSITVEIAPPPTLSFEADPPKIVAGAESTLSWLAMNASYCQPVGEPWTFDNEPSGSRTVTPEHTTTYTLECSGPLRSVQASATVRVPEPAMRVAQLLALTSLAGLSRRRS